MGKSKGSLLSKIVPSKKGKEKGSTSTRTPQALTISSNKDPSQFKIKLPNAEARRRWSHLINLQHKHCRFLHEPTLTAMGIYEDVIQLARNMGFEDIFTANHYAFHVITVEFLSTLEVKKRNGTPMSIKFQIGGEPHSLTTDELNALINGPENGAYTGDYQAQNQELWRHLILAREESSVPYKSDKAKATSIRNPVFRYLHRLITSTLLSRQDVGTCLSNDMRLLYASIKTIKQHAGCYLASHMESQAHLHGAQRIGIGAFVTPIARHFGVDITEEPISTDIWLDKAALQRQEMLAHENGYLWKLHCRNKKILLFRLPNPALTSVMGEDEADVHARWNMSTEEHLNLLMPVEGPRKRQRVRDSMAEEDEERAEEEEAYEAGEAQPETQGGFRMQAPDFDFETFGNQFFQQAEHHHEEAMHFQERQFVDTQRWISDECQDVVNRVGHIETRVGQIETRVGHVEDRVNQFYNAFQAHAEQERQWREQDLAWREQERARQEQQWAQEAHYHRMVQEMYQFTPFPDGYQRYDPNNPNNPPFPPPFQ